MAKLLLVLVASAHAHLTTVCTSTAPSEPGTLYFWLGTYHSFSGSAAGNVLITPPSGSETAFTFSDKCAPANGMSTYSGGTPEGDLKSGGACGIPADAIVSCYEGLGGGSHAGNAADPWPTATAAGSGAFPASSGSYARVATYIKAQVAATSGTYLVRTTGTDQSYAACYYGSHPCTMDAGKIFEFTLQVAGNGASCAAPPAINNAQPNDCTGERFDGAVCNVACAANHVKSGSLRCDNGNWLNTLAGDPHFHTAHGDRFDFKGKHQTMYNVLSHANVSVNAFFENVDYREAGQKHRLVHGSYMRAAYTSFAAASGNSVRVEYSSSAAKFVSYTLVDPAGEDMEEHRVRLSIGWARTLEGCTLAFDGRQLSITTPEWAIALSNKVKPGIVGAPTCAAGRCFLEVSATPRFDADRAKVAPHGLIGQSYDGDALGVVGKTDGYATSGNEATTHAMGEGAIEGVAADYEMPSKWATAFKFARFGLKSAPPRDARTLTGQKIQRVDGSAPVGA